MKFKNPFKKKEKKKEPLGYFVLINWSRQAIEYSIGNDFVKKIEHYYNNYLIKTENYNPIKIERLKSKDIIIIDLTAGQEVPRESLFIPETQEILGILQLRKVM